MAAREGINFVIDGSIARAESGYRLSVRAVEGLSGKVVMEKSRTARTKDAVLQAAVSLATSVRKAMGDGGAEAAARERSETFTASSIGAMQAYVLGQEQMLAANYEKAIPEYRRAIELDPEMGRAYAGLATCYYNLKRPQEAETNFQQALGRIDRMTERERYRTRGGYYIGTQNVDAAMQEFTSLVEKYPADNAGLANLALAYFYRHDMQHAMYYGRKVLEIYPKNAGQRNNVALYALYSGDFKTAEREAAEALRLNPAYPKAVLAIGLSQVALGRYAEARQSYRKLKSMGPNGRDSAVLANFDLAMLEARPSLALAAFTQEPATPLALISKAEALWATGERGRATALTEAVAAKARTVQEKLRAGTMLVYAGKTSEAAALAQDMLNQPSRTRKANALILKAEISLARRQFAEAMDFLDRARREEDTWWGRWVSARAWQAQGRLAEAHSEIEECMKRKGEAVAAFLDDVPTARFTRPVQELRSAIEIQLKHAAESATRARPSDR